MTTPGGNEKDVTLLRPYLMTAGRSAPVDHTIEIEAQVVTSALGASQHPQLSFERRDIVSLCRTNMSVAEIAAMLKIHIGVARVLVADLAQLGYVVIRRPDTETPKDLRMIERVIRGLEAIR